MGILQKKSRISTFDVALSWSVAILYFQRNTMNKQRNLAWFLLYTGWSAIISNGWWIMATQTTQKLQQTFFIPIFISTFLLSLAYIIVLGYKFLEALDEK